MNKYLDGIKLGFGFIFVISLVSLVYAAGWHVAGEILPGQFADGDFKFNGSVNSTGLICDSNGCIGSIPSGMIAMFDQTCPTGWSEYTAMRGKFARGEPTGNSSSLDLGGSDDAVVVSHSHSVNPPSTSTSTDGSHTHSQEYRTNAVRGGDVTTQVASSGDGTIATGSAGSHSHSVNIGAFASASEGVAGTGKNIPAYKEVIYCIKD